MSYVPRHFHLVGAAATGEIRTAKFQGRDHLVVPVVALVEGVIFPVNADNPELVLAQQFSIAPQGWNGRPIFPNHPVENGTQISGNSPTVLESQAIGTIFNARVRNKRLLMDAYLDTDQKSELGKKVLARARRGEMIEVSVGAFVRTNAEKGSFNGKNYKGVWQDIVPDHLAMLPEGTLGACSIAMGCGSHRAAQAAPLHLVTAQGVEQVDTSDSRIAAYNPDQPRDESGKWTDDSNAVREDEPTPDQRKYGASQKDRDRLQELKKRGIHQTVQEAEEAIDLARKIRFEDSRVELRREQDKAFKKSVRGPRNAALSFKDRFKKFVGAAFSNMGEDELMDVLERYAIGNGNNQYRRDNPTRDEQDAEPGPRDSGDIDPGAPLDSFQFMKLPAHTPVSTEIDVESVPQAKKSAERAGLRFQVIEERGPGGGNPFGRLSGPFGKMKQWLIRNEYDLESQTVKKMRGAVGNGNNQYRQDNPTKNEHASGDRTRVDKVFARTAKSILGAGAKDDFSGGMSWSKDRGYADAKYRAVIAKAEAKGYKEVEVSPTSNPDGSYMGWDKIYRHKNGSEVRISSSYGPTKDYNSHHITITPPKLRTAEAMHDKEDEEVLEPDPEETDLTEDEQKKRYEMTQAERKSALKQKYRYAAEYYDCEECGGTGKINGEDCPHCHGTGKMKVAAGRRHSQQDVDMIQEMHDRSVMLGAACGQERALEHRFAQANSQLFAAFKAAIGSEESELRTNCGCGGRSSATDDAHSQGDTDMASKQERIAALISSPKTPFTAADSKMLEAASDERLTALEAHVASLVTAEKKATDTDTALKAATDNITALQTQVTELKAASEKKPTQEEFLAQHPDLKALVDNAKAQEAAQINALVTTLKTAQSEYSEDELKAMSLGDLNRLARVTKTAVVQPVMDFSARVPRAAETKDEGIPAPPDMNAAIRAAAGK